MIASILETLDGQEQQVLEKALQKLNQFFRSF